MGVEKQIQIEERKGERLTEEDFANIKLLNDFLLEHDATDKEENAETIKQSGDKELLVAWESLSNKFKKRIEFIDNNPDPKAYDITFRKMESSSRLSFSDEELNEDKVLQENIDRANKQMNAISKIIEDYKNMKGEEKQYYEEKIDGLKWEKQNLEEYIKNPSMNSEDIIYINANHACPSLQSKQDIQNKKDMLKSYEYYDKQINNMIENIKSATYLKRLMIEFDCDEKTAHKHQEIRIKNAMYGDYNITSSLNADFDGESKKLRLPNIGVRQDPYLATHEILGHKTTNGSGYAAIDGIKGFNINNSGLSDNCQRLLKQSTDIRVENGVSGYVMKYKLEQNGISGSVIKDGKKEKQINYNTERPGYFERYTERYARKKVMDIEMEDLGVKKYEEEFTESHYNKIMELYEQSIKNMKEGGESILSKHTIEFIETTKRDPKVYIEIFNKIA